MTQPNRPDGVPEDAEWNADENEWELGPKNAEGEPIGDWIWWDPDGHLVCKAGYDDHGELHGLLERWHPNGERAQWAPWVHGKTHGVQVWTLATHGPTDKHSRLPPNVPDRAVRMDMPYYFGQPQPHHFTLFAESGIGLELDVDERGRLDDFASYMEHIVPETTLLLLEPCRTINGAELVDDPQKDTRWIYDGPEDDGWRIRQHGGGFSTPPVWIVDTETLNRCFVLSTYGFFGWMDDRRPDDVPAGAQHDRHKKRWWSGSTERGKRVGEWNSWDDKGRPRGLETYGKPGVLHGPIVGLYSDGSVEVEGQYSDGVQCGRWIHHRLKPTTFGSFPVEHSDVWRVETDFDGSGTTILQRCFRKDGTACTTQGVPLDLAYEDEKFTNVDVLGWFANQAPAAFPAQPQDNATRQWEELTGVAPHPDHATVASFVLDRHGEYTYGWHLALSVDGTRDVMRGNVFENILRQFQGQPLLVEQFCGVMSIGSEHRGLKYMLSPIETELGAAAARPPILMYDDNSRTIEGPFAKSTDHFAYLTAAAQAFCDEKLSPDGMTEAWRRLSGAIRPQSQWEMLFEQYGPDDFEPWSPEPSIAETLSRRSRWIVALLTQQTSEVPNLFSMDDADVDDPFYGHANLVQHVPLGLYVMWRRFFFDEEQELVELIELEKESPSRILRDTAVLLEELIYGREDLPGIEDIHEVREAFLELNLNAVG